MAETPPYIITGFDGMQVRTSRFERRVGDLDLAQNADLDEVGSVGKGKGYVQRGNPLTSTTSTSTSTTSTSTSTTSTSTSTT